MNEQEALDKIKYCEELGFGYRDVGAVGRDIKCSSLPEESQKYEYYRGKDTIEELCVSVCEDLFNEYTGTWGEDASSDKPSESILQCFNECLERNSS